MKIRIFLILSLIFTETITFAQAQLRTFTNAQGRSIQAKVISKNDTHVKIALANGKQFSLAINDLSESDQEYLKSMASIDEVTTSSQRNYKPSPNDKLDPATLNDAVGQALFAETSLWLSAAEKIAKKLDMPIESKTKNASSFRYYTPENYKMFDAHPYSVAMYAENDRVTSFSIVFANKGDLFGSKGGAEDHFDKDTPPAQAEEIVKSAMQKDYTAITNALNQKLGEPQRDRIGDSQSVRESMLRWDWRGHSILLANVEGAYISLQIVPSNFADSGGKLSATQDSVMRSRVLANLESRDNGDVVIGDIPMVDQGPKGYCAPATTERAMRYLGIPSDMYIIANKGNSGYGGGTSMESIFEGMAKHIRSKRRSADLWEGKIQLKDLAKYIDKGVPVIWSHHSTEVFNEVANQRTADRKSVTNWEEWKTKLSNENAKKKLQPDDTKSHVALIIGYNKETNEIAFSDSWGEQYKERWITLEEAEVICQSRFYAISF